MKSVLRRCIPLTTFLLASFLLIPSLALAVPLYPSVTTQAASSLDTTSVVGNGNITATHGGGTVTVRGFVYDADTSYGATTTDSGSYGTSRLINSS
jgi:hypothetical protein